MPTVAELFAHYDREISCSFLLMLLQCWPSMPYNTLLTTSESASDDMAWLREQVPKYTAGQ